MSSTTLNMARDNRSLVRRWLFSRQARRVWSLLLVCLCVAVATLAFLPGETIRPTLGWDKLNHAAAFLVLAFCGYFAFREQPRALFWVSFLLLAFGIGIELVQAFLPYREADVEDIFADAVGMLGGLILSTRLAALLERRKHPRRLVAKPR